MIQPVGQPRSSVTASSSPIQSSVATHHQIDESELTSTHTLHDHLRLAVAVSTHNGTRANQPAAPPAAPCRRTKGGRAGLRQITQSQPLTVRVVTRLPDDNQPDQSTGAPPSCPQPTERQPAQNKSARWQPHTKVRHLSTFVAALLHLQPSTASRHKSETA